MSTHIPWHDQDMFWEMFEPVLFDEQRISNAEDEIEYMTSLMKIQKGERVLDLCCGIGRHSLILAREGFDVVGIDRTASFIEKARQHAEQEHLKVEFLVEDMKDFCSPNSFDVVINLFGSFGYFENPDDDRQVVRNMYATLRPGGKFLIETLGKEIAARGFRERNWSERDDMLVLSERKPIQNWSRIQTRWIVIKADRRVEHTVSVRSYSALELSSLLTGCGFSNVSVYGDLEGRAYDHEAKRLVVIGTK